MLVEMSKNYQSNAQHFEEQEIQQSEKAIKNIQQEITPKEETKIDIDLEEDFEKTKLAKQLKIKEKYLEELQKEVIELKAQIQIPPK